MSATTNKTIIIASYPDGHEVEITKVPGLGWQWGHNLYSPHLASAKAEAFAAGAAIVRRRNPNHRPPRLTTLRLIRGGLK